MVEPGRYKHFHGNEYRVLFCAPYALTTLPRPEQTVYVEACGYPFRPAGAVRVTDTKPERDEELIVEALWVGEKLPTLTEPEVVVYCNLDGVYARTAVEFAEVLPGDLKWARFTKVAP